jgi:aspartate aminotransferase/aminotransferase
MAASLVHSKPVFYDLPAKSDFLPDIDQLETLVTDRTKLILLCTPLNPTGQVYSAPLMKQLIEFAQRHDLWIISDEIYADIVFGDEFSSALCFDDERTLIVSGMSKSYAMTGYRVGFTRGPLAYAELASKLQEPFVSCGTGFSQLASAEALDGPQDCVVEMKDAYANRLQIALDVLRQYDLYKYSPGGAIYLLIDISESGLGSHEFAVKLLEEKRVAVAPGNTFGKMCADHVRVSIASSDDNIRTGITSICEMIHELKAET